MELLEMDGKLEVVVAFLEEILRSEEIDFEVGAPRGVVFMVAGIVHDTGLEFDVPAAQGLVGIDDAVVHVQVVQGRGLGDVVVAGRPGLERSVGKAAGPTPVALPDLSLQAGHDAEEIPLHQVESEAVAGDGIQIMQIVG